MLRTAPEAARETVYLGAVIPVEMQRGAVEYMHVTGRIAGGFPAVFLSAQKP